MIVGDRVTKIESEIKERKAHNGLKLNIAIKDVSSENDRVVFDYLYEVTYTDVGYIKIFGKMFANEEEKLEKEIHDSWKKNKKIPEEYMEKLLNAINFTATSHATLVARVMNYSPPLIPPRLTMKKK